MLIYLVWRRGCQEDHSQLLGIYTKEELAREHLGRLVAHSNKIGDRQWVGPGDPVPPYFAECGEIMSEVPFRILEWAECGVEWKGEALCD